MTEEGIECVDAEMCDDECGINHAGDLEEFVNDMANNKPLLLTYLFGKSFVVTGNDNEEHDIWDAYELYKNDPNYAAYYKGN